jgi:hypothetical protein
LSSKAAMMRSNSAAVRAGYTDGADSHRAHGLHRAPGIAGDLGDATEDGHDLEHPLHRKRRSGIESFHPCFQRMLDGVRTDLARHYLTRASMRGAEISLLLGFEGPNSFFRAFLRWTGKTRREIRPT